MNLHSCVVPVAMSPTWQRSKMFVSHPAGPVLQDIRLLCTIVSVRVLGQFAAKYVQVGGVSPCAMSTQILATPDHDPMRSRMDHPSPVVFRQSRRSNGLSVLWLLFPGVSIHFIFLRRDRMEGEVVHLCCTSSDTSSRAMVMSQHALLRASQAASLRPRVADVVALKQKVVPLLFVCETDSGIAHQRRFGSSC